jgi:hypothetical protein
MGLASPAARAAVTWSPSRAAVVISTQTQQFTASRQVVRLGALTTLSVEIRRLALLPQAASTLLRPRRGLTQLQPAASVHPDQRRFTLPISRVCSLSQRQRPFGASGNFFHRLHRPGCVPRQREIQRAGDDCRLSPRNRRWLAERDGLIRLPTPPKPVGSGGGWRENLCGNCRT